MSCVTIYRWCGCERSGTVGETPPKKSSSKSYYCITLLVAGLEIIVFARFLCQPGLKFYYHTRIRSVVPRQLDVERLESRRPIKTFTTSVIKGEGYPEAFRWLGQQL